MRPGFDTSAYTLSWTLYELTQNPAAYAKAKVLLLFSGLLVCERNAMS